MGLDRGWRFAGMLNLPKLHVDISAPLRAPVAQKDNTPAASKLLLVHGLGAGLGIGHHEAGGIRLTHIRRMDRTNCLNSEYYSGNGQEICAKLLGREFQNAEDFFRMRSVSLKCLNDSQNRNCFQQFPMANSTN
jgi:hypothetical protein